MTVIHSASDATGSRPLPAEDVAVPFDRYEVTVRLGPAKELLGIVQVAVRRDFLTQAQRLAADDAMNASDMYER